MSHMQILRASQLHRSKFSKVIYLVNIPYKTTIELTFENVYSRFLKSPPQHNSLKFLKSLLTYKFAEQNYRRADL